MSSPDVLDVLREIARRYYHGISNSITPLKEGGFIASLLLWAVEEEKIEVPPPREFGLLLKKLRHKKKQLGYMFYLEWRKNMKLNKSTHEKLSRFLTLLYIDRFSRIVRDEKGNPVFNIMGDPDGADVDLLVKVTNQNPIFPPDLEEATTYFQRYFEKDLDIILISSTVETEGPSAGRTSFATDRGGKETINIGFHTYTLHSQPHQAFFTERDLVLPQSHDQIFAIGKWFFDQMKKYMGKERYKDVVGMKKEIYEEFQKRNQYGYELIKSEFDQNSHRRLWKSIVLKVSQLFIYTKNKQAHFDRRTYIKSGVAEIMGEHFPECKEHFLHSLIYRKYIDKDIPGWFKIRVMELYQNLSTKYFPCISFRELIPVFPMGNPTTVSDEIFKEWTKSPKVVTSYFAKMWEREYGLSKIGLQFVEECKNIHLLENFPSLHVDTTPQRSVEWMALYKDVYISGRNTGVQDPPRGATDMEVIIHYSNLIGGNMGESIAFSYLEKIIAKIFPWRHFVGIATVGMISRNGPGTEAFCPDALAIFGGDSPSIVPIEIKTIQGKPSVNNSFLRGFSLARQQLLGAIRVMNEVTPTAVEGLGVFLFIDPDIHSGELGKIHTHLYNFHPDEIRFG